MLLVSYECSRSFAARAAAFAGALSTGWAAPGLAVARRAAALAGGLTGCVAGCAASAVALAATAATRGIRAAALAAFPALGAATAATAAGTVVVAATRAGKLSHRFAACLATATLISRPSAHISRLHQAFLIEPDQIQATSLRKRLHH